MEKKLWVDLLSGGKELEIYDIISMLCEAEEYCIEDLQKRKNTDIALLKSEKVAGNVNCVLFKMDTTIETKAGTIIASYFDVRADVDGTGRPAGYGSVLGDVHGRDCTLTCTPKHTKHAFTISGKIKRKEPILVKAGDEDAFKYLVSVLEELVGKHCPTYDVLIRLNGIEKKVKKTVSL